MYKGSFMLCNTHTHSTYTISIY